MPLELYSDYDRRSVRDLMDPASPFIPGAGSWGIHGILKLPESPGDFVLFVTIGRREGEYRFDESISEGGILRWQSQPRQDILSPVIRDLIRHDENTNIIHLFLRTTNLRAGTATPFTYLGPLKYAAHDAESSKPVHIAWELLAWPIPEDVITRMRLQLAPEVVNADPEVGVDHPQLEEEEPPRGEDPAGEPRQKFEGRKMRYQSSDQSRALGLAGELLVLEQERAKLTMAGRADLATRVEHVSIIRGDGLGYDIASFYPDGRPKYIEVKTTTGLKNSQFFVSSNELAFSEANHAYYELHRLFQYNNLTGHARFYTRTGDMRARLRLAEAQYRAKP